MRTRIWVALGVLLWRAGAAAADGQLAVNGGFEDQAEEWALSAEAELSADRPHTGLSCLKVARTDKGSYRLTAQPITLEPNRPYEISAWVRTEKVTEGQAGGATICLEWTKAGQFYGGEYPKGLWGSKDWTLVKALAKVPADADPLVRLVCYLRRDATGVAWFDDVALRPVTDWPPVSRLCIDAYRDTTAGEPVRVVALLDLAWAGFTVAEAPARLRLLDTGGRGLAEFAPGRQTLTEAEFSVPTRDLPAGIYTLVCGIRREGSLTAEKTATLKRVAAYPPRYSYIDPQHRLIVDGKPFFPLGLYLNSHWDRPGEAAESKAAKNARWPRSTNREHLDLIGNSPFNCIMPYDSWKVTREDLDGARAKGLSVLFSVKDSYFGQANAYGLKSVEDERAVLEREVTRVGDHPAVIAWYINDEVGPEHEVLWQHQKWMEELDPGRPTWAVAYRDLDGYYGSCDVFSGDPYPIPGSAARVLAVTRAVMRSVHGCRAVWMVPQIFDHASYSGTYETSRPPTLAEMRAMSWMCIAAGANGLVYYSFFDLWRIADRQPFEARWADITTMAREIRSMEPVLLSADPVQQPEPVQDADGAVAWRLYAHTGKTYCVTVNSSTEAKTASLRFATVFSAAENVLGTSPARLSGQDVHLSYEPLEVKIVCLTP
jgi:hypothetical protein